MMLESDANPKASGATPGTTREQILDILRTVVDPEIGINIVDLGLVYNVEVNQGQVRVAMTLTTPGCPVGRYLAECATAAIERHIKDVASVTVEIVWDPPWNFDRVSEAARQQLGWSKRRE